MFHFLKRPLSGFCVGFPTVDERSHMAVEALLSLSRAVLCFTFALRYLRVVVMLVPCGPLAVVIHVILYMVYIRMMHDA